MVEGLGCEDGRNMRVPGISSVDCSIINGFSLLSAWVSLWLGIVLPFSLVVTSLSMQRPFSSYKPKERLKLLNKEIGFR